METTFLTSAQLVLGTTFWGNPKFFASLFIMCLISRFCVFQISFFSFFFGGGEGGGGRDVGEGFFALLLV